MCNAPLQVKLSESTNVPDGQLSTHTPSERNEPGRQAVHFNWSTVEATEKLLISHEVHFAPQAGERISKFSLNQDHALTVTNMLVVIRNQATSLTYAVAARRDASTIERVRSRCTQCTVVGCSTFTFLTSRVARLALGPIAVASVWAVGATASSLRLGVAFGPIIGILRESGSTRQTNTCRVGAVRASQCTF